MLNSYGINRADGRSMSGLQALFSCPATGFDGYVERLHDCAAAFEGQLELIRIDDPAALARRTSFAAFVSPTQPTLVVVRDDDMVGEAIGDLPSHELRGILRRAVDASESVWRRAELSRVVVELGVQIEM